MAVREAPEMDPATAIAAIALLLGSLAVDYKRLKA
jgi:hypothetical protein